MPWAPELFSAPALARLEEKRRHKLVTVRYFDGLMAGELDALLGSFSGEPELHHPVRGRVKGAAAFARYAAETRDWLAERNATVEDVDLVLSPVRGVEEVVVRLDGIALPVAIATDHDGD